MNKKGISGIIVTVLIIVIALAGIILMWNFIKPVLNNARNLESGINSLNPGLTIAKQSLVYEFDSETGKVLFVVRIQREAGSGDIDGVIIALTDSNGKNFAWEFNDKIKELESKIYRIDFADEGLVDVKSVSITPVVINEKGEREPVVGQLIVEEVNEELPIDEIL